MKKTAIASKYFSVDEFRSALKALDGVARVRLEKVANFHAGRCPDMEWSDLMQEAITRTLEGTRNWPCDVSLEKFLEGAMRSIASDCLKSRKRKPELSLVSKDGDECDAGEFAISDPAPNPETALSEKQTETQFLTRILDLFKGDMEAQFIVEAMAEGMEKQEIIDLIGLDETSYASKRRFIRRRFDKNFRKGGNNEEQ